MVNQSDWMRTFNQLISEKGSVKLYNTYRGLPLIADAAILEIKEGKVTTSIFGYQAVSMALAGRTHLYSPGFHEALRANVIEVDFKKKRAILSDFSGAGESVGKRRLVRVEPSETLEVQIYDGRQKIGGKLTDISTEGMCIVTYFAYLYGLKFQYDKKVFIDFKPPYSDGMVRCMGIISNMSGQEGTYLHRLGLRTIPSPYIKPLLDDYINRRQKELMNEMERTYISMQRKKTKRG